MSFAAILMADTTLFYSSLAVTGDAYRHFHSIRHTHF